jgi:hypothetical protein
MKNLIALWLVISGLQVSAQDARVSAKLDQSRIALGDQTVLRLTADLPVNGKIEFPQLVDTISSKISIVETGKRDTVTADGRWKISQQYTVTSFEPGVQVVPSFAFINNGINLNTESIPLEVSEVKVDTTKAIFDIKQPITVKYNFFDWLRDNYFWVILGLLIVGLVVGIWLFFRKTRKPALTAAVEDKQPLYAIFVAKLYTLKMQKLWENNEMKLYYSELTDILRDYLEKRYKIRAMEQTTEEILASLQPFNISESSINDLKKILLLADLVKFAKQQPLFNENQQSMDNAIAFVIDNKE